MASVNNNSDHQSKDKWKDTVNNLKSRFSTPSLSIFNENLTDTIVSATESMSLSLPLGSINGKTEKFRERVKTFGSDMKRLRSKSCERVFQRCRKGFDRVAGKEQQPQDYFHQNATLRQSRRSRTRKAKPSKKTYSKVSIQ